MASTVQLRISKTAGKPIRCRAAVARKAGEPLVMEEVIVAPPKSHEVRLKIICTSLCHTDITLWKLKEFPGCHPRILGHEAFGACLLSCGVSTDFRSWCCLENSKCGTRFDSSYLRFRISWISSCRGSKVCGATRIIGVGRNSDKFEIGKQFGVTEFVNSKSCGDKPVSQVIIEMTNGGADYCFECVGLATLVQEAFACCRKGWGKTIVLGLDKPDAQLNLSSFEVLQSQKTLTGSFFGGLKPKSDVPILDKELELDKFVTHEVNFEDINKAFDLLIQGNSLHCVIWMDK